MKRFFLVSLIIMFVNTFCYGQYPIVEEYNIGTTWIFLNGSGIQNYGPPENYATTNVGNTPYPNNAVVDIISPIYDFTSTCSSNITISFPISGLIEDGFDYLSFQYFNGAWVTDVIFTGFLFGTYTNNLIPNTTTQFRFRLFTDPSFIIWYNSNGQPIPVDISNTYVSGINPITISVYYNDIARFIIDCVNILPIELEDFDVYNKNNINHIYWVTSSEINNDYFTIERSYDGEFWNDISVVKGGGNSNTPILYEFDDDNYIEGINYYRLTQTDFDGNFKIFETISINNTKKNNIKIIKIINLIGQEVDYNYFGIRIIIYEDGNRVLIQSGVKNNKKY